MKKVGFNSDPVLFVGVLLPPPERFTSPLAVAILIFTFVPWLRKRLQMRKGVSATSEAQSAVIL